MKIDLKQVLLFFLLFLKKVLRLYKKPSTNTDILIIQLNFIGDVIMTTPLIYNLKKYLPFANIDILVRKPSHELLRNNPNLRNTYTFAQTRPKYDSLVKILNRFLANRKIIIRLFKHKYSKVIHIGNCFEEVLITTLISPEKIIGIGKDSKFSKIYDYHINQVNEMQPLALTYLKVLPYFGIENSPNDYKYDIHVKISDDSVVHSILQNQNKKIITIAPFAGWSNKEWPIENFIPLSMKFNPDFYEICFLGSQSDLEKLPDLSGRKLSNLKLLFGKTTLEESAYLISKSSLFIGLDSSMAKIAEAFNVLSVIIYGGTNPKFSIVNRANVRILYKEINCSAKGNNEYCGDGSIIYKCLKNLQCLREISVDKVYDTAMELVGTHENRC